MLASQRRTSSRDKERFAQVVDSLQARYGADMRMVVEGHWVVEIPTGHARTQVVHVHYTPPRRALREGARIVVSSPIGPLPRRIDQEWLLRHNADLDVGAICVQDFRDPEGSLTAFLTLRASHLLPTADFVEVVEMIEQVAIVADHLEKDLYGCDVY